MSETITEPVAPVTTDAPATSAPATTDVPKTDAPKTDTDDSLIKDRAEKVEKKEEVKVEKVIPEKYEFKVPEGMEMDVAFLDKSTPILKKLGLDQEGANELFSLMVEKTKADAESWTKKVDGWKAETLKELGDNPEQQLAYTSKFVDQFGGKYKDQIYQFFRDTGVGNHPGLVHAFKEAGKFFSSDPLVTGGNQTTTSDPEARARKMFPNTKFD